MSTPLIYPVGAEDPETRETIGNLSARIEDLENQLNGHRDENGRGEDDKNPGARVTLEDLERLRDETRALRDEIHSLREGIIQLQQENSTLRLKNSSEKTDSAISGSNFEKTASQGSSLEIDDETESVLKLLEQSAPEGEEDTSAKNQNKKNKSLERTREMATKQAEETAPALPVGNAEAQYNEAFALYDKEAYKEAERAFAYFIKTYPNDPLVPKAMYWQAECCLKQKKYKDAKILFVTAYKKNSKGPKAPHCLLKLGEVLAIQGKNEDAHTAWQKLKMDFPHMTHEMKSELTTLTKKYRGEKKLEIASKLAPKN